MVGGRRLAASFSNGDCRDWILWEKKGSSCVFSGQTEKNVRELFCFQESFFSEKLDAGLIFFAECHFGAGCAN